MIFKVVFFKDKLCFLFSATCHSLVDTNSHNFCKMSEICKVQPALVSMLPLDAE